MSSEQLEYPSRPLSEHNIEVENHQDVVNKAQQDAYNAETTNSNKTLSKAEKRLFSLVSGCVLLF